MFTNFIWDFDGVILLSDSVREKGFRVILEPYNSDQVEALIAYHRRNGGLSRYHKIRYFYETIRREEVSDEQVNQMAGSFSEVMRTELTDKTLLNSQWIRLMEKMPTHLNHHIASGSDQNELRFLCSSLEIVNYFKSIHGSPTPKRQLVETIMSLNGYSPCDTVLIGDAINDYEAAQHAGIDFWGYNNVLLESLGRYITDLENLIDLVS